MRWHPILRAGDSRISGADYMRLWGAAMERVNDPAFPLAFPWFNTQRHWQDRILELREQIAAMDEPPLVA